MRLRELLPPEECPDWLELPTLFKQAFPDGIASILLKGFLFNGEEVTLNLPKRRRTILALEEVGKNWSVKYVEGVARNTYLINQLNKRDIVSAWDLLSYIPKDDKELQWLIAKLTKKLGLQRLIREVSEELRVLPHARLLNMLFPERETLIIPASHPELEDTVRQVVEEVVEQRPEDEARFLALAFGLCSGRKYRSKALVSEELPNPYTVNKMMDQCLMRLRHSPSIGKLVELFDL